FLFLYCSFALLHLHSFPTRRSSDLSGQKYLSLTIERVLPLTYFVHLVGNNYEHFTACAVYWQLCHRRSTRHSCLYLRQHHWRADLARLVCRRCQPILCSCPPEWALAVRGERDEPAAGRRVRRGLGVSLQVRAV